MTSSASYRSALLAMSNATAAFANAMERCSGYASLLVISRSPTPISSSPHRLKGSSYEAGTRLQAAAGVHHLVGNLWHVLVRTVYTLPFPTLTFFNRRPRRKPLIRNSKNPFDSISTPIRPLSTYAGLICSTFHPLSLTFSIGTFSLL